MSYIDELGASKAIPVDFLKGIGVNQHDMQDGVFIHYGEDVRTRWRTKTGIVKWLDDSAPIVAYGSCFPGNVALARELGWAFIVEGESDCWALWLNGFPAFGLPGASQAGKLHAEDLDGIGKLFVVQEPDEAGSQFPARVAARIVEIAPDCEVFAATMPDGVKDPSDLWVAHSDDAGEFHSLLAHAQFEAINRGPVAALQDEGEGRTGPFIIVHGDDIESLPEPKWLIEDVLIRGSFAFLWGASGLGKTFVALDMAGCIAAGLDWHGLQVHQGTVLYIAAEGVGDLGLRVEAFRESRNLDTLPGVSYVLEPVNLMTNGPDELLDQIAELEPVLIVVDTLARSMAGGDENQAKDIATVVAAADYLRRETGATVLFVHHCGHDKSRERGSSALRAAADTAIEVKGGVPKVTLVNGKMKMARKFKPIAIELAPVARSLAAVPGLMTPTLDPKHLSCATLVPDEGTTHGAWLEGFLEAELGSESTFNRTIKTLQDIGIVEKRHVAGNDCYFLSEEGHNQVGVTGAK